MSIRISVWTLWATGCVAVLCITAVWSFDDSRAESREHRSDEKPAVARSNSPTPRAVMERVVPTDFEVYSTDWSRLARTERIERSVRVLEDIFSAPAGATNCHRAATTLSVLRADLIQQDGERSRYDEFEARYDAYAEECEKP